MKIDVEKIKTAYEAASAEQKKQMEKMFPEAFECAESEDSEETIETLVDKLRAWRNQNQDNRVVALFVADKDRTKEEGNTVICITGNSEMLLNLAACVNMQGGIKKPFARLFSLAILRNIKDYLKDSKHGTDN